jgi:hypothetical protein
MDRSDALPVMWSPEGATVIGIGPEFHEGVD